MVCAAEVHIGDVGTLYRVRVLDDDLPLDPSDADVAQLIFSLPGGVILTKDATVTEDGSPPTAWFLEYQVVADDGAGSPPGDFHAEAGRVKVQAFLAWPDGTQFHSDIQTKDEDGKELRIFPNLG